MSYPLPAVANLSSEDFLDDLDGPGCGVAEHDPACLCDVDLANAQPVEPSSTQAAIAEIGVDLVTNTVDLELMADFVLAVRDGNGQWAGHDEGVKLLAAGMSLKDIAIQSGLRLADVVALFTQMPATALDAVLEAESLLRAGADSYEAVARATGLTPMQCRKLGIKLGGGSRQAAAVAQGRGPNSKYTTEQIAQAWALRDQGLSYRQIHLAMPDVLKDTNAAVGILRRNARPADIPSAASTVAS